MPKEHINLENEAFDASKTLSDKDKELVRAVIGSAKMIHESFMSLPKLHDMANFAIAVTKRNSSFIKIERIGKKVSEGQVRMVYTEADRERRALEVFGAAGKKLEYSIPTGTVHAGDFVVSVSGAREMCLPVAIGTLVGAKIINYDEAMGMARELNCLSAYSENASVITDKFFKQAPTLEGPLLPDTDILNSLTK